MTTETTLTGMSGRDASILRRRMLSQGKAALPKASERVRSGFRDAAMPADVPSQSAAAGQATPEPAVLAPVPEAVQVVAAHAIPTGRAASIERRRALSMGKGALPAAKERVRSGFREAAMPVKNTSVILDPRPVNDELTGRDAARQHRANRSKFGGGTATENKPVRLPRKGDVTYPKKVQTARSAVENATVTGLSFSSGRAMTGAEAGHDKPLTGTQYVGGPEGGYRSSLGKVGHTLTDNGQTVSGTMVRSSVMVTGDEDSADVLITGNADQSVRDGRNRTEASTVPTAAQFSQQSQPHGQSVFGANLGRSARVVGSRSRDTERPVEQTEAGHAVSGTAIGRSSRVTGDEPGALRSLTGTQYLAPAGYHNQPATDQGRSDPASGGKVARSQTYGGQTITGPEMEHDGRVTGSEHGTCQNLTGTPYFGANTVHGWCDAENAQPAPRVARAVTGNVPMNDPNVSGTHRGADRDVTGSRYFVADEEIGATDADSVSTSITEFSVSSPQRASHLKTRASQPNGVSAITGNFSQGDGKITGNIEFQLGRKPSNASAQPARKQVSGEGSTQGYAITGSAWSENRNVTGTEDHFATLRNPTERRGSDHSFAGATRFKSRAPQHQQSSPVTGAVGSTQTTGASVTLSGGAAG